MKHGKKVNHIDLQMTWRSDLQMLLMLLQHGNSEGQSFARQQLTKMADLADKYVASQK